MERWVGEGSGRELTGVKSRAEQGRSVGTWLAVMMFAAFGALALAVLTIPFLGFGSLILVFLTVCGAMLLVIVGYRRRSRETYDAWKRTEHDDSLAGRREP